MKRTKREIKVKQIDKEKKKIKNKIYKIRQKGKRKSLISNDLEKEKL